MKEKLLTDPGYFAKFSAQRQYEFCQSCPLTTDVLSKMPVLVLPLRFNLIRCPIIGCSPELNTESVEMMVIVMNTFWEQTRIHFELISVEDRECELRREVQNDLQFFIMHTLCRSPNETMMHKAESQDNFLDVLLSSFDYMKNSDTYDIWVMDIVGHQSQGICIDRKRHTVIMGERSTKGYDARRNDHMNVLQKRQHMSLVTLYL